MPGCTKVARGSCLDRTMRQWEMAALKTGTMRWVGWIDACSAATRALRRRCDYNWTSAHWQHLRLDVEVFYLISTAGHRLPKDLMHHAIHSTRIIIKSQNELQSDFLCIIRNSLQKLENCMTKKRMSQLKSKSDR